MHFLQKRGLIALATAPGDGEVTVIVGDETFGEDDPLLAQLLAAATAGLPPAGPAERRAPLRLALSANAQPLPKGRLCAEHWGFKLHAATRVHRNDKAPCDSLLWRVVVAQCLATPYRAHGGSASQPNSGA